MSEMAVSLRVRKSLRAITPEAKALEIALRYIRRRIRSSETYSGAWEAKEVMASIAKVLNV